MEKNTLGTDALVGETVVFVDTSSINVIHFHCKSGKVVSIDAEEQHFGLPETPGCRLLRMFVTE